MPCSPTRRSSARCDWAGPGGAAAWVSSVKPMTPVKMLSKSWASRPDTRAMSSSRCTSAELSRVRLSVTATISSHHPSIAHAAARPHAVDSRHFLNLLECLRGRFANRDATVLRGDSQRLHRGGRVRPKPAQLLNRSDLHLDDVIFLQNADQLGDRRGRAFSHAADGMNRVTANR